MSNHSTLVESRKLRYRESEGEEIFGSFEFEKSGIIAAFVRMRITSPLAHRKEIKNAAVIRELRVYGKVVRAGEREEAAWQHRGLGASLMRRIEAEASEDFDAKELMVTSAVGTRDYYRKLGYERSGPYMSKALS